MKQRMMEVVVTTGLLELMQVSKKDGQTALKIILAEQMSQSNVKTTGKERITLGDTDRVGSICD